jgi:hypothetical protein
VNRFWPPVTLALASLAASASIALQPAPRGPIAAVFPPWWSAQHTMLAAAQGGPVIRFGAWSFIVITGPGSAATASELRRQGAWLLLNPVALGACGQIPPEERL